MDNGVGGQRTEILGLGSQPNDLGRSRPFRSSVLAHHAMAGSSQDHIIQRAARVFSRIQDLPRYFILYRNTE